MYSSQATAYPTFGLRLCCRPRLSSIGVCLSESCQRLLRVLRGGHEFEAATDIQKKDLSAVRRLEDIYRARRRDG